MIADRFRERFGRAAEVVASAPGRVNLIGEHTDYNEGFVLPMAIDRRLHVAASRRDDARIDAQSTATGIDPQRYVSAVSDELKSAGVRVPGVAILIESNLPAGAGLSSSAALELATLRALCALVDAAWDPARMARTAQRAENERVGVRCGVMDQMASALGRSGHALLLDCRSLKFEHTPLPRDVTVVVMDTGMRRTLPVTEYNARRAACDEAVAVLRTFDPRVVALRDATPALLARARSAMADATFRRATHVVHENERPRKLADALAARDFARAGALMNESHASLRDLYDVSSTHLDIICDAARAHPACYGARMTGAGWGGCAIALVRAEEVDAFMRSTQPPYEARTYKRASFFPVLAGDGARLEPS